MLSIKLAGLENWHIHLDIIPFFKGNVILVI